MADHSIGLEPELQESSAFPFDLRQYAVRGRVTEREDVDPFLQDDSNLPQEWRESTVGALTVQYYRLGEPGGLSTEEVVAVLQGSERVYEAVYDGFSESGQPTGYAVGLFDLSPAQLESLQQAIAWQQPAPSIQGYAPVQESYSDRYSDQAATVATVVALAQRGESFDRATYDSEAEEAFFYRVPNSTLIVNRVEATDRDGTTTTYTVLDEDEPLFELDGAGRIALNNLTLSQLESLQTAQREGANPLLVDELYFQADIAQALTIDGAAQARALLSQGDAITPAMVAELNQLMTVEEEIRREEQAERGLSGEVRYPRFNERELNRYLSRGAIAMQLNAQFPVVEAQVVAESQSQQPVVDEDPLALASLRLQAGQTLVCVTDKGNYNLSLSLALNEEGESKYLAIQTPDGSTEFLPRENESEILANAFVKGALVTQDEQPLTASLDQQRPQPVVQAPPAVAATNGQRVTAAPEPLPPVAPNVQTLILKQSQEVIMTIIEAPAPVELKPIRLDAMLSEFGRDAMRGITGTRNTYNPSTQRRGTEERTPGETFSKFAKGAYGIENFCKDNGIPFQGSADYLVNKTALELDLSPEFKAEILSGIKREECVAPIILAAESEAAAWKRVYEVAPETFTAVASPAMQETIAQDASVIAQSKAKTLETLGITIKTAEPTRDPAKLGYEPAPATPDTAALMTFRDSLTASQLREWATAVQVNEPQNTDKQKWVADFTTKFQKSGYEMSDGGMSVGMAKRLTEVQQQMGPAVQQLRTEIAATINQMLSQAPNAEGKDYKKLDAQKLGLTIKGNEGNFEVKGATGKLLMLAKDGEVTINRLPATVVSRMEGMMAMQQQMQQAAVQQRTVAAPAKKPAAAVER